METSTQPIFEETQHIRQTWAWLILLAVYAIVAAALGPQIYRQLYLGEPAGDRPMSDEGLIAFCVLISGFLIGLGLMMWFSRLEVRVDGTGLTVRYVPFLRRRFSLDEIRSWEPVTYSPIGEYGGWGIHRSWRGNGWSYTVSGNRGVMLDLSSRERPLLIGSREPEALAAAIARAKGKA